MVSKWRDVALEEVADELTVGFVGPMASEYVESGVPFLRSLNVEPLRINKNDLKFITPEFHQRIQKSRLTPGDVVIVRTGKPGACSVIPDWLAEANCSDLVIVRCGKHLNNHFLAYYVNTVASNHVAAHLVGAVQQHFNVGSARTLRLKLPSIAEQENIVGVLGSLDNKIELNRRMNETLEAMARALFKSWFVDFDPVHAKAAGRKPEGMDAQTAVLFPNSFQDSPLGKIPNGWTPTAIYECAEYLNGLAFKADDFSMDRQGLPILKIAELKDGIDTQTKFTEKQLSPEYRIEKGDLLFSWSGSPGTSIDTFIWAGQPCWLNQHIFKVTAKPPWTTSTLFALLKHLKPQFIEIARDKQTTGLGHVTVKDLKRMQVVQPPNHVAARFNQLVNPIFERMLESLVESQTLTKVRDALLPKLLSGEINSRIEVSYDTKAN